MTRLQMRSPHTHTHRAHPVQQKNGLGGVATVSSLPTRISLLARGDMLFQLSFDTSTQRQGGDISYVNGNGEKIH